MNKSKMKQELKTIGVLGGMGPATSADFYRRVIEIAQRDYHAEQDTDFPPMFIYNMPLAGFDETGSIDDEHIRAQLIVGVQKIEKAGSDFIVIPCNTVHAFYDDMQVSVHIPIINILDVTVKSVEQNGYQKVGLMSSESTRKYHLYENAFTKQGIAVVLATDREQKEINRVILHVMAGRQGKEDISRLRSIVSRFAREGAQAIILGCTELPLAISPEDMVLPLFSSTALLADAAVRYSYAD